MNKIKSLIMVIALMFFFACNENGSENTSEVEDTDVVDEATENETTETETVDLNDVNKLIVGNWRCTVYKDGEYIFDDSHIFNEDGSFTYNDGAVRADGTWKIADGTLSINVTGEDEIWGKIMFAKENEFSVVNDEDKKSVYVKK